jgi:hypothetical protein
MADTSPAHQAVDERMHALLEDAGLPAPDEVQYGHRCVRLLWHDRKVAVVIDLDPDTTGGGA